LFPKATSELWRAIAGVLEVQEIPPEEVIIVFADPLTMFLICMFGHQAVLREAE
jgi:hypothetical protein